MNSFLSAGLSSSSLTPLIEGARAWPQMDRKPSEELAAPDLCEHEIEFQPGEPDVDVAELFYCDKCDTACHPDRANEVFGI